MDFARFFLKKGEEREIRQGFLWAFDNEIERVKFFDGKEWKLLDKSRANFTE